MAWQTGCGDEEGDGKQIAEIATKKRGEERSKERRERGRESGVWKKGE